MSRYLLSKPVFDGNMFFFNSDLTLFWPPSFAAKEKLKLPRLSQGLVASWAGTLPSHRKACKVFPSVVPNDVTTFESDSSQAYKVLERNQMEETYTKKKAKILMLLWIRPIYPFTCSANSISFHCSSDQIHDLLGADPAPSQEARILPETGVYHVLLQHIWLFKYISCSLSTQRVHTVPCHWGEGVGGVYIALGTLPVQQYEKQKVGSWPCEFQGFVSDLLAIPVDNLDTCFPVEGLAKTSIWASHISWLKCNISILCQLICTSYALASHGRWTWVILK
jgi:hypothetical protein